MNQLCVVCRHQDAEVVCAEDRQIMAKQLADIPRKYAALGLRLIRGAGSGDGQPAGTRVEAASPVNDHVLSLMAAGSEQVSAVLRPLVRRFPVTTTVKVQTVVGATTVVREHKVTKWFTEAVGDPDDQVTMVCDDDQIGVIPPREWADVTVRAWRAQLGHHVPARTGRVIAHRSGSSPVTLWPAKPRPSAAHGFSMLRLPARHLLVLLSTRSGRAAFALLHAVEAYRRHRVNQYLGLLGAIPAADRPTDPIADDIETRFGEPPRAQALAWDIDYLLTWLDTACDRDLGIADFAGELAALTAELERALGEVPQQTWIGRCPAFIVEELPGSDLEPPRLVKKPCGAGLWHEPGWAQVPCPACGTVWDVRGPAATRTVLQIRKVWPLDRRRRYTADEINRLRYPACPSCRTRVKVMWREATGHRDLTRTWQPVKATCAHGCDAAAHTL